MPSDMTAPASADRIRPAVRALAPALVAVRRDLHQHAELSTEEHRTQAVILDRLKALALDDVRAVAGTGATALIRGARPGPNLLWRADIDALPIVEETGLPFASTTKAMHACAHDGHVAIALGIAEALAARREALAGTVRFAFQPAEEHVGGAKRMVDEGVMDDPRVDHAYGLHIWAGNRLGEVLVTPGAIMAAATHFRIIIRGRGGHAASPHQAVDPIVTAAHAVVALQTIVSRSVDPHQTTLLTIGRIHGGERGNIIPDEVMMSGTIRTFDDAVLARVLKRAEEILRGVTAAFGADYRFDTSTLPAVVNDPEQAALVAGVAAGLVGPENVGETRVMGADDVAYFLQRAPGVFFLLGAAPAGREHVAPHHSPRFDFDEACLPLGVELALRIVEAVSGSSL
jgi:amidohydrolase